MTTAVAAATMKAAQVTAPRPIPNRHCRLSRLRPAYRIWNLDFQPAHA
jgi:hypothetical protein